MLEEFLKGKTVWLRLFLRVSLYLYLKFDYKKIYANVLEGGKKEDIKFSSIYF